MIRRLGVLLRAVLVAAMLSGLVVLPPAAGAASEPEWMLSWARPVPQTGSAESIAVADDGSYYVAGVYTIAKYAADGDLLWVKDPASEWTAGQPGAVDCDDEFVYMTLASTSDGKGYLVAFDASNGERVWAVEIPDYAADGWSTPKLAVFDGIAYVPLDHALAVAMMDTEDGAHVDTLDIGGSKYDKYSDFYGIEVGDDGIWVAYYDDSDHLLERYTLDGEPIYSKSVSDSDSAFVTGDPALHQGTLYVPCDYYDYATNRWVNVIKAYNAVDSEWIEDIVLEDVWDNYRITSLDCDAAGAIYAAIPGELGQALKIVKGLPVYTQEIDNGLVKLRVEPTGRPAAFVWHNDEWVAQYYNEDAWDTVLWLNGRAFNGGYFSYWYGDEHIDFELYTPVSNEVQVFDGWQRIVTVYDAGDTGVRITQVFTLMDGDRHYTKEWTLDHLGGEPIQYVRLYHGGDTTFGGDDSASSYYDAAKSMVYLRNESFTDWGIMGFWANPATPASHYFSGEYDDGNRYPLNNENLPDTVDPDFLDAGYHLQWNKLNPLFPGESWSIQAYEIWTPGGALQVLAPGSQNVIAGSTVVLPFTLHNISEAPQDLELSVECDDPTWGVEIIGETSPFVGAIERIPVPVRVTVPEGATETAKITLHAEGPETNASGSTRLSIAYLDFEVEPTSAELRTRPGEWVQQDITVTNNSDETIKLGVIGFTDRDHFGNGEGEGNFREIDPGSSTTFPAFFGADDPGTYTCTVSIPITSPMLVTATVQLTGIIADNVTLTYLADVGGSIEGSATQVIEPGADGASVRAVPDAGYTFNGWSDGVKTAERRDMGVTENLTVTATFRLKSYTLTYVAGAGGSIEGEATQFVEHGSSASAVTAKPRAGFRFVRWSDGVRTAARTDTNVQASARLTAIFEANVGDPKNVTFGANKDGRTTVTWSKAPNATGYRVFLNGKQVATVGAGTTSYTFRTLLGPKARVSVRAMGPGASESKLVPGVYRAARSALAGRIRFSGHSDRLSPSAQRELRRQADIIKQQGFTRVEVGGHTSTVLFRGEAYHRQLSQKRADVAKRFLEAELKRRGVKATVVAKGYGKSRPVASNATWWGRHANRRADIELR